MNKQTVIRTLKGVPKVLKKHSPALLTGIGIAGMLVTTITAVKATPKALQLIDEKEIKEGKRLTNGEIVKATWKCYLPSAVTGACSIICLVGANSVSARRNAALATAYTISETALKEYKEKAVEVVGEKKEQSIRDAVAKDKLEKALAREPDIVITGVGEVHCFEPLTNTPFKSDSETIRKAMNDLNKRMRDEVTVTVNDWLMELGLEPSESPLGEDMGWDIDKGYIDVDFSSHLIKGIPYLVVGHHNPPRYIGRY